jgi:hypothetical protein
MPTYGRAKSRDMARSVLPSTARKGARFERASIHRAHRHAVRQRLRGSGDPVDLDLGAYTRWPQGRIKGMVYDRRGADKVAPVMRWSVRVTAHMPIESRLDWLRSVLPDGTIGRHAMSHVDRLKELDYIQEWRFWWPYQPGFPARPDPGVALKVRVRWALDAGLHKNLNREIGRRLPLGVDGEGRVIPPRKLLGAHDVDGFVADVVAARDHAVVDVILERLGVPAAEG